MLYWQRSMSCEKPPGAQALPDGGGDDDDGCAVMSLAPWMAAARSLQSRHPMLLPRVWSCDCNTGTYHVTGHVNAKQVTACDWLRDCNTCYCHVTGYVTATYVTAM